MDGDESNSCLGAFAGTEVLCADCAPADEVPREWMPTRNIVLAFALAKRKMGFSMLACCTCTVRLDTQLAYSGTLNEAWSTVYNRPKH